MMTRNKFAVKRGAFGNGKMSEERGKMKGVINENTQEGRSLSEMEAFEDERRSYQAEKLEFHAQKALAEENLPTSFAKLLCGADEAETLENIALFKEEFMKAVEAALSERLKGVTPKTYTPSQDTFDPFLSGFGY